MLAEFQSVILYTLRKGAGGLAAVIDGGYPADCFPKFLYLTTYCQCRKSCLANFGIKMKAIGMRLEEICYGAT
jgi:hypothetical protein